MNALELKSVTKHYRDFTLDSIDLALPSGAILGLVGENGAGKTTTIKLILDMLRRDGGTITLFGRDARESYPLAREDVGVMLDEVGFSACLTARNIARIMRGIFRNWDDAAFAALLGRLNVPENKAFKELSLGMKKKLGLAAALAHRPKLLLLDEPMSGLDPIARDEVLELFSDFTRDEEHAILISSHIVSDLEKLCDYIAFLHRGRLLLCEEKDRLHEEYGIVRCSLDELRALPEGAVLGRRTTPYGAEALMRRGDVPAGLAVGAVDIEQLFIFMAKEEA